MRKKKTLKTKRKKPLKWKMIGTMALVWLLPLLAVSGAMFFYISGKWKTHMEESIFAAAEKAVEICEMRFQDAVGASRNASYLPVIREEYEKYRESGENPLQKKRQLYDKVTGFLNDQYRYNTSFLASMLYFREEPEEIYYTYSNMKSATFDRVTVFREAAQKAVQKGTKTLDTGILLLNVEGNLYMARNMMTPQFEPFAVLVMELDKEAMCKSLESMVGSKGYAVFVNGKKIADRHMPEAEQLYALHQKEKEKEKKVWDFGKEKSYVYESLRFEGQEMEVFANLDSGVIMSEQKFIPYMAGIFVLSMFPLFLLVLWFLNREINCPVRRLVEAAGEIEKGNLGYCLPEIGNSRELCYLGTSFNQMSAELKKQFDTIYSEELALRDARIKALQSQINPHFLNNTLEIINWEARMNGNYKVSGMIEALSTMLEAALNRSKASFISLAEELSYMDAYLYIVERRFEDRLEIRREIQQSLLQVKVPRLIIQPIVENAVEHGIDRENRIRISISVRSVQNTLLEIQIKNQGALSRQDKEKIERLLRGETEQQEKSLNLGIRNVNQRLKMLYDEACGLTIEGTPEGCTVSTLLLKLEKPAAGNGGEGEK